MRTVGLFDLDKEGTVVCQSRDLVCSLFLLSLSLSRCLAHSRRVVGDGGMCAKLHTYARVNNTVSVSENVLHRLPIGEHVQCMFIKH